MTGRVVTDELEFDVPYGKLCAKTWHEEEEDSRRVLLLHGWMDNAGSFDNVVPLLKRTVGADGQPLYVVGLDLPGHGKSSQLPPGASYSDMGMIMEIRRCLIELDWVQPIKGRSIYGSNDEDAALEHSTTTNEDEQSSHNSSSFDSAAENLTNNNNSSNSTSARHKFTLVGHSLGAGLALWYSGLFPAEVEQVFLLDFIKSPTFPADKFFRRTADSIDRFLFTVPSVSPANSPLCAKTSRSGSGAVAAAASAAAAGGARHVDKGHLIVGQDTAVVATIDAHKSLGSLSRDQAACLLKRSTVPVSHPPNCVIYSRDLRLQAMLNFRDCKEANIIMFRMVKCPVFAILARNGLYVTREEFKRDFEDIEAVIRQSCKQLCIEWVEGDHYSHMNNAAAVAAVINKYL